MEFSEKSKLNNQIEFKSNSSHYFLFHMTDTLGYIIFSRKPLDFNVNTANNWHESSINNQLIVLNK